MSRRQSKHLTAPRPLLGSSLPRADHKADGRWIVHPMPGARALKAYRCPGCAQTIAVGAPHLVVWPDTPALGVERAVDDRRHWHTACWGRRL
ncbi:MAG: hypothetical protein LBL55_06020 [Propionibacteriaceae bacterium]|jgi:hypothetical protein|nr:hypothetical protein [Propionibacteriaceae bacterium]